MIAQISCALLLTGALIYAVGVTWAMLWLYQHKIVDALIMGNPTDADDADWTVALITADRER